MIQLTDEQSKRLKALAAKRGVSVAELVRQGVESVLALATEPGPEDARKRALEAAGRYRSNRHDVAARHDDYLRESYR